MLQELTAISNTWYCHWDADCIGVIRGTVHTQATMHDLHPLSVHTESGSFLFIPGGKFRGPAVLGPGDGAPGVASLVPAQLFSIWKFWLFSSEWLKKWHIIKHQCIEWWYIRNQVWYRCVLAVTIIISYWIKKKQCNATQKQKQHCYYVTVLFYGCVIAIYWYSWY